MTVALCSPLREFSGHSLVRQAEAELMNRVDTKFVVPVQVLETCLIGLQDHYSVLEIDGSREFCYDTLYFDTPERQLYLDHHNGKLNRCKIRVRHYRATGQSYLEVKKKTNRQRTEKQRLPLCPGAFGQPPTTQQIIAFLTEQSGQPVTRMSPALFVRYQRATLMNAAGSERITIDTRLRFDAPDGRCGIALPKICVVELKYDRKRPFSPLMERLAALDCRPMRFSKYCAGTSLLFADRVKTNSFKPLLRSLHGIRC